MKRVFSLLLVLLLVVGLVPVQATAEVDYSQGPYQINAWDGDYQLVTIDHTTAHPGETITVTPKTGYKIVELMYATSDGEPVSVPATSGSDSRSFTMPGGPIEVVVDVESADGSGNAHEVYLAPGGSGSPSLDATTQKKTIMAKPGDRVTVTPNPLDGYAFLNIQIDYPGPDGGDKIYDFDVPYFTMPSDIQAGGKVKVTVYYQKDPNAGPSGVAHNILLSPGENGTASAVGQAMAGDVVVVTVTPNPGYMVTANSFWTMGASGVQAPFNRISKTQYHVTMPDEDLYIGMSFETGEDNFEGGSDPSQTTLYNITVETDGNGTLISNDYEAEEGGHIAVTATPNSGYELDKIIVTDGNNTADITEDQKFYMPASDVTVRATFKAIDNGGGDDNTSPVKYDINTQAENGTVTTYVNQTAVTQAAKDETVTVTVTPSKGYELDTLTVKDGTNNAVTVTDGKFTMPQSDVTVTATFKVSGNGGEVDPTLYFVDVRNAENGSVSANPKWAAEGTTITLTANPDTGYELDTLKCRKINTDNYIDVNVNGNQGQFTMPASDVMVIATFKRAENADGDETTHAIHLSYKTNEVAVTASATEAKAGETVTITTTPKKFSGGQYAVKKIMLYKDGDYSVKQEIPLLTKSFIMPDYDVLVMVVTELAQTRKITYQVVKGVAEKTSISAPGNLIQLENGVFGAMESLEITIGATPADGYELEYINVYKADTGELYVSTKDGKFSMPNFDVRVDIAFESTDSSDPADPGNHPTDPSDPTEPQETMYNITVIKPVNGTVAAPEKAKKEDSVTVSTEPDEGFVLDQITVIDGNGQPVTVTDGKFTMPESGVTVTVTFKAIEYNVKVTTPENGTLVAELTKAKKGDTVTVNATPAEGYKLIDITVTADNGKEITMGADNTFTMPASDVTVAATIVLDQKIQVSFDPNTNTDSYDIPSSELDPGSSLEDIPSVDRKYYVFLGWFTEDGTPVTPNTVFVEDTTVYGRWAAHTTKPGDNDFNADIAMDDGDVVNMLVTDEDMKSGLDVVVYMTVDEKSPSAVPTADYNAINSVAGTDRIGAYLDIQLFKQIGNDTPFNIHNTKDNLVPITVQLPDTVIPQNAVRDSFYIIYHHVEDGETITSTVPATFDVASKTLSFSASRFSTYALAYTTYDVRFDANGGAGTMETQHIPAGNFTLPTCSFTAPSGKEFVGWKIGSMVKKPGDQITLNTDITITAVWKNKTSGGTLDSVPKTGDTSGLAMWTLLILCSTTMLAGVAVCDKRRAR